MANMAGYPRAAHGVVRMSRGVYITKTGDKGPTTDDVGRGHRADSVFSVMSTIFRVHRSSLLLQPVIMSLLKKMINLFRSVHPTVRMVYSTTSI